MNITLERLPRCRGCGEVHHPHDPCEYIKAQVPAATTLPEVRAMLKRGLILNHRDWLAKQAKERSA